MTKENIAPQQAVVIDSIPVDFEGGVFLHSKARQLGKAQKKELLGHLHLAESIARPKVMYMPVPIRIPHAGSVEIMDYKIENPVLYNNLRKLKRAFVYIATCGQELAEWKASLTSAVDRFFVDLISESALGVASDFLREHIAAVFHTNSLASMNPGSTHGWRIEDQRVIFSILASAREQIGVELRKSYFVVPTHSASGILFESEKGYQNCQLCTLQNCPNRQAPFDPQGYQSINHTD